MKKIFLLLICSIILNATEFKPLPISLIQDVENSYERYSLLSKIAFKAEGKRMKGFGENFYNLKAGVEYLVSSVFGIETGYQLLHSKIDSFEELNPNDLGLYGKLILKF